MKSPLRVPSAAAMTLMALLITSHVQGAGPAFCDQEVKKAVRTKPKSSTAKQQNPSVSKDVSQFLHLNGIEIKEMKEARIAVLEGTYQGVRLGGITLQLAVQHSKPFNSLQVKEADPATELKAKGLLVYVENTTTHSIELVGIAAGQEETSEPAYQVAQDIVRSRTTATTSSSESRSPKARAPSAESSK